MTALMNSSTSRVSALPVGVADRCPTRSRWSRGAHEGTRAREHLYYRSSNEHPGVVSPRVWGCLPCRSSMIKSSVELGRTSRIANVEISAVINMGLDFLALGQPARAFSALAPTLGRVQREVFGAHRWRWTDETPHGTCRVVLYHRRL